MKLTLKKRFKFLIHIKFKWIKIKLEHNTFDKENFNGQKIVIGNLKGGVGKTTNSVLFAYTLASKGFKVLLCDLDPLANSTDLMTKTYKRQNNKDIDLKQTMMQALREGELKSCMLQIKENLFVLPSSEDFIHYQQYLFSLIPSTIPNYEKKHRAYFGELLRDFIEVSYWKLCIII